MIFMSQSGITDPAKHAEWSAWYVEHLRIMRSVDGIDSAERFQTTAPNWPPSLAMYSIRSAEVFVDPYYLKIRGMGPWAGLIEKRFYQRNLFEAVSPGSSALIAPEVPPQSALVVTDQIQPHLEIEGLKLLWLKSVGLDQSTPYRGIAVISKKDIPIISRHPELAVYR